MKLRFQVLSSRFGRAERFAILVLLVAAAALPLPGCAPEGEVRAALAGDRPAAANDAAANAASTASALGNVPAGRLRLVDVGADRCVPCRAMAPILEELRVEYVQRLEVIFVDVWKNPEAGKPYGVEIIPTQVFYDGSGRELWRHQGFISKRDILANWKRLGYDLESATSTEQGKKG